MQLTEDEDADADMEVADGDDQGSDEEDEMNAGDPQPAKQIKGERHMSFSAITV